MSQQLQKLKYILNPKFDLMYSACMWLYRTIIRIEKIGSVLRLSFLCLLSLILSFFLHLSLDSLECFLFLISLTVSHFTHSTVPHYSVSHFDCSPSVMFSLWLFSFSQFLPLDCSQFALFLLSTVLYLFLSLCDCSPFVHFSIRLSPIWSLLLWMFSICFFPFQQLNFRHLCHFGYIHSFSNYLHLTCLPPTTPNSPLSQLAAPRYCSDDIF